MDEAQMDTRKTCETPHSKEEGSRLKHFSQMFVFKVWKMLVAL